MPFKVNYSRLNDSDLVDWRLLRDAAEKLNNAVKALDKIGNEDGLQTLAQTCLDMINELDNVHKAKVRGWRNWFRDN